MGVESVGTPSIFTAEAVTIPVYVPPDQLRERLDAMYKPSG